jgi:RimJ/RimL family protein N-acetyltransferase
MTHDEATAFISEQPPHPLAEHDQWFQIAIADKHTDELIGDIGLCTHAPGTSVEIGFTLAPSAQGQGLATEACRAAIGLAFSRDGVEWVEAIVDTRNLTAIALVKRLGMSLDRTESSDFKGEVCTEQYFVRRRAQ